MSVNDSISVLIHHLSARSTTLPSTNQLLNLVIVDLSRSEGEEPSSDKHDSCRDGRSGVADNTMEKGNRVE